MRSSLEHILLRATIVAAWLAAAAGVAGSARADGFSPEAAMGKILFSDEGLARPGRLVSCRTCHFTLESGAGDKTTARSVLAFADRAVRSAVPERDDGRATTPRNSPTLVDALAGMGEPGLMHFDGEFTSAEALVQETFLGRNFGWLPGERAAALRHFARWIREDDAPGFAAGPAAISYRTLLRATDSAIPPGLRLPAAMRFDPATAADEEVVSRCAQLVVAFMRTLQFSRDADALHNGSPYDAFLAANRLARAPARDQTPAEYSRQLGERIAALRAPRFIDEPGRALRHHAQPFRFGEQELQGMRIFFRSAIGEAQKTGAGNCAECHIPPHFSDFKFHNTGAAQDEYDALHAVGAFRELAVPDLARRDAAFDRWLPATAQHPGAAGPFLRVASRAAPGQTDLGLWNVYANPDLPAPQRALESLFNPTGALSRGEVLARTLGRFKTSAVRDLGQSAPYLHTGHASSIEDVIVFYQRMSGLAHAGGMRNAPPEFFAMRLGGTDVAPLAAFLRALNEDFERPE